MMLMHASLYVSASWLKLLLTPSPLRVCPRCRAERAKMDFNRTGQSLALCGTIISKVSKMQSLSMSLQGQGG